MPMKTPQDLTDNEGIAIAAWIDNASGFGRLVVSLVHWIGANRHRRTGQVEVTTTKDCWWIDGSYVAVKGYGPLLYDIVMELAHREHGFVHPGNPLSEEAEHVWDVYLNRRPDVLRVTRTCRCEPAQCQAAENMYQKIPVWIPELIRLNKWTDYGTFVAS